MFPGGGPCARAAATAAIAAATCRTWAQSAHPQQQQRALTDAPTRIGAEPWSVVGSAAVPTQWGAAVPAQQAEIGYRTAGLVDAGDGRSCDDCPGCDVGIGTAPAPNGCLIGAPWLVSGVHGASVRQPLGLPLPPPPPPPCVDCGGALALAGAAAGGAATIPIGCCCHCALRASLCAAATAGSL
jgi:hypothetical protein